MSESTENRYSVKRRHPRYGTAEPIYASLTHMPGRMCRVRDISVGGLGLECSEPDPPRRDGIRERSLVVNIFFPGTEMRILGIPYEIVHSAGVPSSTPSFMGNAAMRIGLRFKELSDGQQETLRQLLREHCAPLDA